MIRSARLVLSAAFFLLLCVCAGSRSRVCAAVFRDRAQFNAAAQNLQTIDFEAKPPNFDSEPTIDGIRFEGFDGVEIPPALPNTQTRVLRAASVGELTRLNVYLPPGTTAVGCDQFSTPMIVSTSEGESVTMSQSDGSTFVGFVSDTPIRVLTFFLDFPEPTPDVLLDNLSYGQRRAGNEPPAPQLLAADDTGRAVALNSVTNEAEPFPVVAALRNLASDDHTRVTLFLVGVSLDASDAASVTAQAVDSQQRVVALPVEAVGRVKNLTWMSQVTVRLPDALSGAGDVSVSVNVRGAASNKATLRVN